MSFANLVDRMNAGRLGRLERPYPPLERIGSEMTEAAREELHAALLEVGFNVDALEGQGLPRRALELVYSLEIVAALICADVPAGPTRRLMLDRLKQLAVMVANAAANGADVDDPVEVTSSDERNSRSVESDEGSDRHARTP